MKKTKTSAVITIPSSYQQQYSGSKYGKDRQIQMLERQDINSDHENLQKKYNLLKKQNQLLKDNKTAMNNELQALKKVLFQNSDIHEVLELQHKKIFDLQTQLQILQKKYDRLLAANGSTQQTQLAIKCKQLQKQMQQRQIEHQKEINLMKGKLMKMNASQINSNNHKNFQSYNSSNLNQSFGSTRLSTLSANNNISPLRQNKKLV